MAPGGSYAIEDTHSSYLGYWHGGYRKPGTLIETVKSVVDDVNHWWHQQAPVLEGLASVHLYPELCVFVRETTPFRGGGAPDPEQMKTLSRPPA